jgi:uncharacterized membrane protein YphA (DoxX/SURF4 family)
LPPPLAPPLPPPPIHTTHTLVIPAGAVQENVPGVVYCACPTMSEPVTPPRVTPGVICTSVRVIAILLLLVGSALMLYGIHDNYYLKIGSIILIVFLIIATFLYHPPTDPKQINNFLKNLSLMGGLGFIIIREI